MADILLAEDDDGLRRFLAKALAQAGHQVVTAENGAVAKRLLDAHHFNLLITDIVMPEMDGIQLARHATREVPNIRVLFITGFAAVALRDRPPELSEASALSKPFHLRDLVRQVDLIMAA